MKRILFLLHLPPPVHGSSMVGRSIKESTKINQSFECCYVNLLASKTLAESGKVNLRKIFGFVLVLIKIFFSLVNNRPQICYMALTSKGAAFYKDLLLVALLKLFRIKRLYHLHNKGFSLQLNKSLSQFCNHFVFNGAEVILLSKYLYTDVQQYVPEVKVHICPNGILDGGQIEKSKECTTNDFIQLLFLSNLIESKGTFILLEACALLNKKTILFDCTFIGGEGDITANQFNDRVKQLGLNDRVSYQGGKFGEEKKIAFSKADIFVFPTYEDCFPLVLMEAMSYSLPIVSTFEGGIPDVIEENVTGFLIPQQNASALADKLEFLIKNPNLRFQMGIAGRKKYEKEFTLKIFEHRLKEILQLVIENK